MRRVMIEWEWRGLGFKGRRAQRVKDHDCVPGCGHLGAVRFLPDPGRTVFESLFHETRNATYTVLPPNQADTHLA